MHPSWYEKKRELSFLPGRCATIRLLERGLEAFCVCWALLAVPASAPGSSTVNLVLDTAATGVGGLANFTLQDLRARN
jgi:hypothetical protein